MMTIRTKMSCGECGGHVDSISFDFVADEQKLEPCGHHSHIQVDPIGPFGLVPTPLGEPQPPHPEDTK
jgi:hypothetical protein